MFHISCWVVFSVAHRSGSSEMIHETFELPILGVMSEEDGRLEYRPLK